MKRQKLGEIGETAVKLELLKMGFDVIDLNQAYKNYKHADLICLNAENGKSTMIQVKTGTTKNILVGFTSELDGSVPDLDNYIVCPWVFVYINEKNLSDVTFYVLTKEEVYDLISTSCKWYATAWNRTLKSKPLVGVDVAWLKGKGTAASAPNLQKQHSEYKSPLASTSKNEWNKITSLLK